MGLKIAWGAVALSFAACEPARSPGGVRISIPSNATKFSLSNGLEVVLNEDHRAPFVALNLRYHVGGKDDPVEHAGLAHLYEHLMFCGSAHVARDDFLPTLDRLGARAHNGTTTRDYTEYFETVPANALDEALWLEADRMQTAVDHFDEATLAREKQIVDNEEKLKVENSALGNVSTFIAAALYPPGHPYRHLPMGTPETLRGVTLEDLHAFHDRYYGADNATLVLVGDFDSGVARRLIESYFGPAAPSKAPPPARRVAAVTASATKRIRVNAAVPYGAVRVTWPLPVPGQPGFYESWAGLTLAGWTVDSRAVERKLAESVSASFAPGRLSTTGEIRAVLAPGASADAFVELVSDVIHALSNATRLTYLPDLRSSVIGADVFLQEDLYARASRTQFYDEAYGDPNHVMPELRALDALESSRVIDAYGSLLAMDRALVTVVVADPQAPLAGAEAP